jgi:hypothetical protein
MTVSTVSRSEAGAARAASLTEPGSATALPGAAEQDAVPETRALTVMPDNLSGTDIERAQP